MKGEKPSEAWRRAGFEVKDGQLERIKNGATDVRTTAKERGRANLLPNDPGQAPELERVVGNGALGKVQAEGAVGRKFLVRITSFRKRLLDEDNLCEKYHCDLCRYARIIPSDAPGFTKIEVCQEKVGPKEPERVKVEVYTI